MEISKNSFIIATVEPLTKLILRNKLKSNLKAGTNLGYSELKELIDVLFSYDNVFESETELKEMEIAKNAISKGYKYFYYGVLDVNSLEKLAKFSKYRKEIVEVDFYYYLSVSGKKGLNELLSKKKFTYRELLKISKDDLNTYLNDLKTSLDNKEIDWGFKGQLAIANKRLNDALSYFNLGIESNPNEDFKSWYYVSKTLMALDKNDTSFYKKGYSKALEINPDYEYTKWDFYGAKLDRLNDLEEFLVCLKNPDNINPNFGKLVFIQLIDVLNQIPDIGKFDNFTFEKEVTSWRSNWNALKSTFIKDNLTPTQRLLDLLKEFIVFHSDANYCLRRYWERIEYQHHLYYDVISSRCSKDKSSKVEKITDFFEILYHLSIDFYQDLHEHTDDYMFESSDGTLEYWFARQFTFDWAIGDEISGDGHQPYEFKNETFLLEKMYEDKNDGYKMKKIIKSYDFTKVN